VVKDGKAVLRQVKLGHRNGVQAEIVEGLAAGEVVIVQPDGRVSDNVRVREN
jgi:HlyD family secretion protein